MAGTSGISSGANGVAAAVLTWLANGTTTALTAPYKVVFLSAVRTANNGTDTEWATSGGYTASGAGAAGGVVAPTFAAASSNATGATIVSSSAVTLNSAPAQTWAGNRIQDTTATNRELWYAPLTGGNKTVNSGDTCTIPSGSLTLNLG
jgi:hypothetical protein